MLIGEYKHSIDAKKRLSIPSKFRKELGDGAVLTMGLDGCLFIFPIRQWNQFAEKLANMPFGQQDNRSFARLMLARAIEVDFDSLGRILIPDYLREYAGLKKVAIVAGLYSRLEIWDEQRWGDYRSDLERNSDKIAEKLGDMGII